MVSDRTLPYTVSTEAQTWNLVPDITLVVSCSLQLGHSPGSLFLCLLMFLFLFTLLFPSHLPPLFLPPL